MTKTSGIYIGSGNKKAVYDLCLPESAPKGIIIFLHGFMGYKDWGCWNLVQTYFVQKNYAFIKYNITHGGTTMDETRSFVDLKSFSENTYSHEIEDFESILSITSSLQLNCPIHLIGHSRGGGIALLQSENEKIKSITSWAGISDIGIRFPTGEALESWKINGVRYQLNGRTMQELPMNYSIYQDYCSNIDRLDIKKYCVESTTPICIIHGTEDASVSISEGEKLANWTNSDLIRIDNSNHTFNSSEPWKELLMPEALQEVCEQTYNFIIAHG